MIFCMRPVPSGDHLHEARFSRWSIAQGQILRIIICKRHDPPDDHLQHNNDNIDNKDNKDNKDNNNNKWGGWGIEGADGNDRDDGVTR